MWIRRGECRIGIVCVEERRCDERAADTAIGSVGTIARGQEALHRYGATGEGEHRERRGSSGVVGSELFYYVYISGTGTPEAGDVAESRGVNVVLHQQLIADIKALIVAIEDYAKTAGLQKPPAAD